ncbi:DNA-binding protein [Photorhabdus aegyptia]|uniref:helix-turn-helix domain-containing transcriptional regulator n=1 Tax=Photorhabdus aegyptia TaxID=2805098 RepID=UPI000D474B7F|nr:transcriptional regulator [Photorhabdus aegyptia]MCC8458196.1 addiction module antidote protein [Photorhabdus aegyptia]PQQ40558.1 transcriptional regulator [Photorhabdus luminescens]
MDKSVKNKSAIEHLSPELNEDRKTQDVRLLLETARQVAEAHGGLSFIAKETGLSRESLYRALSATGNPTIRTLCSSLNAIGMRLEITPIKPTRECIDK